MLKILKSTKLTDTYTACTLKALDIARTARPGQMALFRTNDQESPEPCPIVDCDVDKGTLTIVTRRPVPEQDDGYEIELTGPLGRPADPGATGKIICVAEGLGIAALIPRLSELKTKGWYTLVIAGYASKDAAYWTDRLHELGDELYVVTDDGSLGIKGPIRHTIKAVCEQSADIDRVFAVGPLDILRVTADVARKLELPTRISLNAIFGGNGVASPDAVDNGHTNPSGADAAIGATADAATASGPAPPPEAAFDWSEAADLDGLEQDFDELSKKLGFQLK